MTTPKSRSTVAQGNQSDLPPDWYERLIGSGVRKLYYLPGETQLGDDGVGTVDGSHPTDLGFFRMAEAFGKVIEPLLQETVGAR